MKNLVLIFCFLFSPYLILSQSDWLQTNGPYTGSMKFIGQDWNGDLFAISENNYLYRSKDSAENWERISDNTSAMTFTKDSTYLLGNRLGGVFIFNNKFELKKQIKENSYSGGADEITDIYLDSNYNIYLMEFNHWMYISSDTGSTWKSIDPIMTCIDSNNYYYAISYDGTKLLQSKDLGQTYDTLLVSEMEDLNYKLFFIYNNYYKTIVLLTQDNFGLYYYNKDSFWNRDKFITPISYIEATYLDSNGDIYIFGDQKISKSSNGGFLWNDIADSLPFRTMDCTKMGNFLILSTWNNGIVKYNLKTNEFDFVNQGIISSSINEIAAISKGVIYVATEGGLFRSTNSGNIWEHITLPNYTNYCMKVFTNSLGHIYVSNDWPYLGLQLGFHYSTDDGNNWTTKKLGKDGEGDYCYSEFDDGKILVGKYDLFLSDDLGKTWKLLKNFNDIIVSISTYKNNFILVGTYTSGIYLSDDGGNTFRKFPLNVPENYGSIVLFDSKGNMYISMNAWQGGDATFYSTDMGLTFKDIHPENLRGVRHLRLDKEGNLFLISSNYGKLYYTKDNGVTWKKMNQGILDSLFITDVCFADEKTAYLGTLYNGIYRTDNYSDIKENELESNLDMMIYPNPASDYIEIIPPLEKRGLGGVLQPIQIFDVFGNEIHTPPPSGTPQEGNFRIDISHLPAGVYFVKIGEKVEKFIKI